RPRRRPRRDRGARRHPRRVPPAVADARSPRTAPARTPRVGRSNFRKCRQTCSLCVRPQFRGPPSAPAGEPATREVPTPRSQKLSDQDVTETPTVTVPEESGAAYEANPEAIDPAVEETT